MENQEFNLRVSRLAGEITQLAALITLETEMRVYVRFSANVNQIEVAIHPNGYTELYGEEEIRNGLYLDTISWNNNDVSKQKTIKKLMKIKWYLINILKEKKIDYGIIDYSIETVEYKRYVI